MEFNRKYLMTISLNFPGKLRKDINIVTVSKLTQQSLETLANVSRHELLLQHVVIPARQIPPLLLLHNVEEKIDYSGASLKPGVCHKDAKRHLLHLHKTHWDVTKQYLVSDQIRLYRHVY